MHSQVNVQVHTLAESQPSKVPSLETPSRSMARVAISAVVSACTIDPAEYTLLAFQADGSPNT